MGVDNGLPGFEENNRIGRRFMTLRDCFVRIQIEGDLMVGAADH